MFWQLLLEEPIKLIVMRSSLDLQTAIDFEIERPVSSGNETYSDPNKMAMAKQTSEKQTMGKARYTGELAKAAAYRGSNGKGAGMLHGSFVQSSMVGKVFQGLKTESVLSMEGVVAVISAENLPKGSVNDINPEFPGEVRVFVQHTYLQLIGHSNKVHSLASQTHALRTHTRMNNETEYN